jgi:hypothetical protein
LNLARGKTHPRAVEYWIWLGGFATAALVLIMLGRIALRLIKQAQEEAAQVQRSPAAPSHSDLARPVYVSVHEK